MELWVHCPGEVGVGFLASTLHGWGVTHETSAIVDSWYSSLRLQQLISTALLEAVNANDTELVLQYENLLVASKYMASGSEDVIIGVGGDDKGVEFDGNVSQSDIIIQYSSGGSMYIIQVTQT